MTPSIPLACVCFAIAAVAFPAALHALWVNWREERRVRERLEGQHNPRRYMLRARYVIPALPPKPTNPRNPR